MAEHLHVSKAERVLFVDDDPHMRRTFQASMRRADLRCDAAASGIEALQFAKRRRYTVVACDLRMPNMDGFAALTRLTRLQPRARFVIVTGLCPSHFPAGEAISVAGKLVPIIEKPWDETRLLQAIAEQPV